MANSRKPSLVIHASREFHHQRRQPALLRGLIGRTLERFGIDKQLARYQFVLRWKEIVGEDIAQKSRPESVHRGVLLVRVISSAWAQELSFQKDVILVRLKRILGDEPKIRDIRFCVGME